MFNVLLFALGASLGSFFSLIAARFPYMSIIWPPSECDNCSRTLRWYDNIPIVSQLWLHFHCRFCGKAFPKCYTFAEVIGGLLLLQAPHLPLLKMGFLILMFLLAIYDLQHLSYPIFWWLVSFPIFAIGGHFNWITGIFLLLTVLCARFDSPYIGAGDLAILASSTCLFSLHDLLISLQIASLGGIVVYFFYKHEKLPFLPFLFVGFAIVSIF
jgi:leader peptidase (prepilin peptidase)/N-methyltransferase